MAPKRKVSPKSLANLKKFTKGVSGNAKGRPKKTGPTLKDWQEFALEPHDPKNPGGPTRDDKVMTALYDITQDKDGKVAIRGIEEWQNRVRGKSPDTVNLKGKLDLAAQENPITTALEGAVAATKKKLEKEASQKTEEDGEGSAPAA